MNRRFHNGAVVTPKQAAVLKSSAMGKTEQRMRVSGSHPDAYSLAIANQHKPWAGRWLRARRESFNERGLVEISL